MLKILELWRTMIFRSRLSYSERKLSKWKRDASSILKDLTASGIRTEKLMKRWSKEVEKSEKRLDKIASQVKDQLDRCIKLKEQAEEIVERHDDTLEAVLSENQIFKEGMIPIYALECERLRSQVEAGIALQAMNQASFSPRREES